MKITCIASSQIPSDTANSIQVMKVCQAFAQLGHEVTLLVPGSEHETSHLQRHYGLTVHFSVEWLPVKNRHFFPWKAVLRAREIGTDLLYCWPLQSAVLGLLSGMPAMVELHDLPSGRFGRLWLKLFLSIPGRKRLLPITDALRRALHLPEETTVVAPDGVDLERYASLPDQERTRRLTGLPEALTVLCTGHLYPGRGTDLFLALAEKFQSASFVWVGGRPADVQAWKERAAHLSNVIFTGFVPNESIPVYQASGDVLLMPYSRAVATSSGGDTAEVCSPMKMFEYMAAGRAILSSDLAVLHEVLDESTAVFCPMEDTDAWIEALRSLLQDEKHRQSLGGNALRAVEKYSWIERARRSLREFK